MNLLDLFVFVWAIGKALAGGTPTKPPDRKPRPRPPNGSRRNGLSVVPTSTPPWPQVVPSGLPPFPGAGWQPDEPPPPEVVARANALLGPLWSGGEGTFKVEQTAGRWIAYRATQMGEKRGVVAFRESAHAAFLTPPPSSPPIVTPGAPVQTASARPPSSAVVPASSSPSRLSLPTLRIGSRGPDVQTAQRALGITADGIFGPGTQNAARQFQRARGLTPDGVIGPATWAALLAGKAA
ncbi:MAG TPA: peptidoglycan-binding domain-containing protein [Gammaproteobacteria bacterium]